MWHCQAVPSQRQGDGGFLGWWVGLSMLGNSRLCLVLKRTEDRR